MTRKKYLIVTALLSVWVLGCAPMARLKFSSDISFKDNKYSFAQIRLNGAIFDVLELKSGAATEYKQVSAGPVQIISIFSNGGTGSSNQQPIYGGYTNFSVNYKYTYDLGTFSNIIDGPIFQP